MDESAKAIRLERRAFPGQRDEALGPVYLACFEPAVETDPVDLVAWAVVSRNLSTGSRRVAMVAAILIACGVWAFVRTGGSSGSFENDKVDSFGYVSFYQSFQNVSIVITSITSVYGEDAVTGRLRNITVQKFEYRLQEQELNSENHQWEIVNYVAWEPSTGSWNGITFEVSKTGDNVRHKFKKIEFELSFANNPVFLSEMQTTDGENTANIRWEKNSTEFIKVQIDEEQSKDAETKHTTEVVGYIVFSY